jgi:hypothetical protein
MGVACAFAILCAPGWGDDRLDSADLGMPPASGPAVEGVAAPAPEPPEPPEPPRLPALPAAPALPLEDEPPVPPPPPARPVDEVPPLDELPPLPPDERMPWPEGEEVPLPGDVWPADEVTPPPDLPFERAPCPLPPLDERLPTGCRWETDDCGRPLDPCGDPLGFWDLSVEAVGTFLEDPSGPLGVARPGGIAWDANDYGLDFGARATLGFAVGPENRAEIRGTWYGTQRAASTQVGVFGFTPPPGGTSPAIPATLRSRAELFGGEVNWWYQVCCRDSWRLLWGLGYRYVAFDETATFNALLPLAVVPVPGYARASSEHQFHFGQLHAAVHKKLGSKVEAGVAAKVLLGSVSRDVRVEDANVLAGGAHAARREDSEFAWGGELELSLAYQVSDRITLTASYALLYLDSVVRAYDGMDFTRAATGVVQARQQTDTLLVHSFFAGFRVRF